LYSTHLFIFCDSVVVGTTRPLSSDGVRRKSAEIQQ